MERSTHPTPQGVARGEQLLGRVETMLVVARRGALASAAAAVVVVAVVLRASVVARAGFARLSLQLRLAE